MKDYSIRLAFSIITGPTYSTNDVIRCEVSEKLPANVDPQAYIRKRLAEEVKRHFDQLVEPIENKTEEAIKNADPLTEPDFI